MGSGDIELERRKEAVVMVLFWGFCLDALCQDKLYVSSVLLDYFFFLSAYFSFPFLSSRENLNPS